MANIFQYGKSKKIDLHDKNTCIKERLAFAFLYVGRVTCDDLDCSEEEMEVACKELEFDPNAFDKFAKKGKDGKLARKFNTPKKILH